MLIIQQQFAGIFTLTVWHFTHTSYVSLHESVQRGMQQREQFDKTMHQIIATIPIFFLGRLPVSFPQEGQGVPLLLLLLFPRFIIIGCA